MKVCALPRIVEEYAFGRGQGCPSAACTSGASFSSSVPTAETTFPSRRAGDLGISRSEFFARAAQRYLDELDAQSLTKQVDDALDRIGAPDDTARAAVATGHRLLAETDDEW